MNTEAEVRKKELKDVEFYTAQVNAWLNTRFEHDKSLLTLSAGGVGILITVMLATGVKNSAALTLYCFALLSFIVCLAAVLWIFRRNADYLEKVVSGNASPDTLLSHLDKVAVGSFLLGVLFSSLIGVSSAVDSLLAKENEMTEQKNQSDTHANYDSVNGATNMQSPCKEKSVNGIGNLKPPSPPIEQPVPQSEPPASNTNKDS
jgi:hypothetical protein